MTDDNRVCRVCLQPVTDYVNHIYDEIQVASDQTSSISYEEAFEICSGYAISDLEPQVFCEECSSELLISLNFKQKCEKSQQEMSKWVQKRIKTEEIQIKTEIFVENLNFLEETESQNDKNHESDSNFHSEMESQSENQTKNRRGKYRSKENRSFTCDLCDRMYIERNNLLQHYNIKHPEAKTAVCDHCNKLQYPQLMTSHVQRCRTRLKNLRHAGKNQTPIRGKYKKRDPTREKVVSRVKSKGLCPICGVERSQSHIKDHLERQASDNKPFICDICGSKLSSRIGIFFHMQVQHLKIPFKCRYCDKEFRTSQQVETHTRKIHPEHKKVLKCEFCEYTTDYHTSLRTHRAKHTGKTFHKCNICGKEFIQKEKYNFHVALHSEERNFACEICGARFKTRRYVKVHQRTHFEKNYECPVCQKTFSANQLMTNHVKNKHPEYQLPPPGTIMSKSYRKLMAEKKLKEEAMRKGADQRTVDAIVVHEAPPIEELHMIQSFGARHD